MRPRIVAHPGALQEKIGGETAHEEAGQDEPPAQQDHALFWDYSDRSSWGLRWEAILPAGWRSLRCEDSIDRVTSNLVLLRWPKGKEIFKTPVDTPIGSGGKQTGGKRYGQLPSCS